MSSKITKNAHNVISFWKIVGKFSFVSNYLGFQQKCCFLLEDANCPWFEIQPLDPHELFDFLF